MEIVVYLALFVLASVFCFSLFILIIMCRRRMQAAKHFRAVTSLRFTKVSNNNTESVVHLGPLIAQVLDSNQWIYSVSGMLQHCVIILKLCHALTEKLSTVPLNSIASKLNEQVVTATGRIMPRFDDLIRTMASSQVDVRSLEACASSLVSACWAVAFPFTVINPKQVDLLGGILNEMEDHVEALRLIIRHIEQNSMECGKDTGRKSPSLLATVIEETPLITESSADRNDSTAESQQSDEAPADPEGPVSV